MSELVLVGLDGSNPLAFLAALGTLRTLSRAWPAADIRMRWQPNRIWNPVIHATPEISIEIVVAVLDPALREMDRHPAFAIDDNLKIPAEKFRDKFARPAVIAAHDTRDRTWADFVAAFGCDAVATDDVIQDTALRTMSGAGHQHFLKTMRELVQLTTAEHLEKALFQPWRYEDDKPSLRWDPADDRRYALRWNEPSGDPIRTVRGANRLAVEALPLLPTMPVRMSRSSMCRLETTGFTGKGSRDTFWTWPIWATPISLDSIRSLLALRQLQEPSLRRGELTAMGIEEVYRSQRLTIGKIRNFAPAQPA